MTIYLQSQVRTFQHLQGFWIRMEQEGWKKDERCQQMLNHISHFLKRLLLAYSEKEISSP